MLKPTVLGLAAAAFLGVGFAVAQSPAPAPSGIKRTPLQKVDFPSGYNIITVIAEIPAGGSAGRHTHPGVDTGYVLEGEGVFVMDGAPDKPIKAGDSYAVPAGVIHDVKVTGDKPLKVMAVYVVEKDKPVATPAPAK
jgi:quercetin dioxygenase-like cupin family protein